MLGKLLEIATLPLDVANGLGDALEELRDEMADALDELL